MPEKFQSRDHSAFFWMRCVKCNASESAVGNEEQRAKAFDDFKTAHEVIHAPRCPVMAAENKSAQSARSANSLLNTLNPEFA